MVDYLRTTQVGSRFIRDFIWKGQARRFVTETIDGVNYTKILDKATGKTLLDSTSSVARSQVGEKAVITKTRVNTKPEALFPIKTETDRVYAQAENGVNELVETREIATNAETKKMLHKKVTTADVVSKTKYDYANPREVSYAYEELGTRNPWYDQQTKRIQRDVTRINPETGENEYTRIMYNNRGLPLPLGGETIYTRDNLKLLDLRKFFQRQHPDMQYQRKAAGLESLDASVVKLNNLDKYI